MFESARHVPLGTTPWDAGVAVAAIGEIVSDAIAHFDQEEFWPAHPLDGVKDGNSSVYLGAAGLIWGLDYLRRVGATKAAIDFKAMLPRLLARTHAAMTTHAACSMSPDC